MSASLAGLRPIRRSNDAALKSLPNQVRWWTRRADQPTGRDFSGAGRSLRRFWKGLIEPGIPSAAHFERGATLMKQCVFCVLSCIAALTAGAGIRFTQHWKVGYCRGYVIAIDDFRREAVRAGHAHWERGGERTEFRWNEVRKAYSPGTPSQIPGLE